MIITFSTNLIIKSIINNSYYNQIKWDHILKKLTICSYMRRNWDKFSLFIFFKFL